MKRQKRFLLVLVVVMIAALANAGAVFAAKASGSNAASYRAQIRALRDRDQNEKWGVSDIAEDGTMYASYAAVFCGKADVAGINVYVGMGKAESLPQHVALARGYYSYSFKKLFRAREYELVYYTSHKWDDLALYNISGWADFHAQANIVEALYNKAGYVYAYRCLTTQPAKATGK